MEAGEAVRPVHEALRTDSGKKSGSLAATLTRYGGAIEADFAHHYPNHDVAELWRRRRWRLLLNLIDHLPAASHYAEAQANDDEFARATLQRDRKSDYRPRISEWSPIVAELTNITDRLGEVTALLLASLGQQPKTLRPRPRPETAFDRVMRELREEQHNRIVARLLPGRPSPDSTPGGS